MTATKAKILDAASDLFLEGGVRALSVRAISARAGQSTIGIYSHFQGKQGVLDALYIEGFERVGAAMAAAEGATPRARVMDAIRRYLDTAEAHEAHYRLIFGEATEGYTPSPEAETVGAEAFKGCVRVVSALLPADAPLRRRQDVAMQIWAMVHGYVSLKHHAVSGLVDMSDWKSRALDGIAVLVDAIAAKAATD
ncbi:MAG: TetR/AcrR family transcriptional regulator [Pseudomonadota bacterium]